ncbi:hypothetical protein NQ317_008978 [Molorchus minor]|uniref:Factor VIII intron 22 protein n=1 Tax=Molorchus minor TaxID=1323400 RepID=A0ABQ9JBM3_9CUCU|nr:hypothetical protein NQ317_008978 [Molorchus minor]
MSSETTDSEILDQYRNISNKLKKRFLRKPNVTEACESFINLAKQCEINELPAYAGLCWIAAARCEGSLSNNTRRDYLLNTLCEQFLKAEETDYQLGCSGVSGENLQAGLSCYSHAASRFPENSTIPIGLNLEIVEFLKKIYRSEYIQNYLESSIKLSEGRSDTNIYCLKLLAAHFVDIGDYLAALETYLEIFRLLEKLPTNSSRCEILLKCEINCSTKLSPNLAKLLEKYTWGDKSDKSLKACKMTEKMFLLLQSLVTICQSLDTSSLVDLESEFWNVLPKQEKELLRILVRIYQP